MACWSLGQVLLWCVLVALSTQYIRTRDSCDELWRSWPLYKKSCSLLCCAHLSQPFSIFVYFMHCSLNLKANIFLVWEVIPGSLSVNLLIHRRFATLAYCTENCKFLEHATQLHYYLAFIKELSARYFLGACAHTLLRRASCHDCDRKYVINVAFRPPLLRFASLS